MTAVTDPKMRPETHVRPWQSLLRGARVLEAPKDVMFDYDDVVFPTMYSIHDLAREAGLHNGDVEPSWSGWERYTLPDGTPCPPEVYWDLWSDFAVRGGYLNTPPIPEAAEAMRRLYFAGHRIHIVTARGFMAHATDIRRWTLEHTEEFGIPWHTLTFAKDKPAAMADVFKASPNPGNGCKGTFDYAIDDSPKNFEALFDAGVESFLLDHAHNVDYVHPMDKWIWGKYRVGSVTEFVDMILEEAS